MLCKCNSVFCLWKQMKTFFNESLTLSTLTPMAVIIEIFEETNNDKIIISQMCLIFKLHIKKLLKNWEKNGKTISSVNEKRTSLYRSKWSGAKLATGADKVTVTIPKNLSVEMGRDELSGCSFSLTILGYYLHVVLSLCNDCDFASIFFSRKEKVLNLKKVITCSYFSLICYQINEQFLKFSANFFS